MYNCILPSQAQRDEIFEEVAVVGIKREIRSTTVGRKACGTPWRPLEILILVVRVPKFTRAVLQCILDLSGSGWGPLNSVMNFSVRNLLAHQMSCPVTRLSASYGWFAEFVAERILYPFKAYWLLYLPPGLLTYLLQLLHGAQSFWRS